MSRTDNTDPYWVRAQWWTPVHFRCPDATGRSWGYSWVERHGCDLPPHPVISRDRPRIKGWRTRPRCIWEPEYPWYPRRYKHANGVPKWFRDHRWSNPERVRVRDSARDMMKEYRADGSVEYEFQSFQHHHRSQWDWD